MDFWLNEILVGLFLSYYMRWENLKGSILHLEDNGGFHLVFKAYTYERILKHLTYERMLKHLGSEWMEIKAVTIVTSENAANPWRLRGFGTQTDVLIWCVYFRKIKWNFVVFWQVVYLIINFSKCLVSQHHRMQSGSLLYLVSFLALSNIGHVFHQ